VLRLRAGAGVSGRRSTPATTPSSQNTGPAARDVQQIQRLVLDRFGEFSEMPIAAITTADSYSARAGPGADATRSA
jgi:hypothetical protein